MRLSPESGGAGARSTEPPDTSVNSSAIRTVVVSGEYGGTARSHSVAGARDMHPRISRSRRSIDAMARALPTRFSDSGSRIPRHLRSLAIRVARHAQRPGGTAAGLKVRISTPSFQDRMLRCFRGPTTCNSSRVRRLVLRSPPCSSRASAARQPSLGDDHTCATRRTHSPVFMWRSRILIRLVCTNVSLSVRIRQSAGTRSAGTRSVGNRWNARGHRMPAPSRRAMTRAPRAPVRPPSCPAAPRARSRP